MLAIARIVVAALCLLAPARAQDRAFERIELRVTSAQARAVVVDRGARDGVAIGDRVLLYPRGGAMHEGVVTEVHERACVVTLRDPTFTPTPGTRGEVRVPSERLANPPETPTPAREPRPTAEHPPWENQDPQWQPGDPLLAKVTPLRPEQRPRTIGGRVYTILDHIESSEDDRSDGFYRVGGELRVDNLTGRGDRLHVDLELNHRNVDVPDLDDESATNLRFDRLSYAIGATRFSEASLELGRFLQSGLPEFGVLDGVEYGVRREGGDRYGVSAGFMPEPDEDYESGQDFQLAAFYRWVRDESEMLSATAGFQKSLHNGAADRDLFVGKLAYLPSDGWTLDTTAWVDAYTAGDAAKGAGLELTQMIASARRRWASGSSLDLTYTHIAFPEIDRNEFLPVLDAQLADDHLDRLAVRARLEPGEKLALCGEVGAWSDEDENGGDAEGALELESFLFEGDRFDVGGFATGGRFGRTIGAYGSLEIADEHGRWAASYRFAHHQLTGFTADNDELPQHQVRLSRDFHGLGGWSFSGYVDAFFWDDEDAWHVGVHAQRSF